jgi:hypothetical protein
MNRYKDLTKAIIIGFLSLLLLTAIIMFVVTYFPQSNIDRFVHKNGYKGNNVEDVLLNSYQNRDLKNTYYLKAGSRHPNIRETYAVEVTSIEIYERDSYEFDTFLIQYPYDNVVFKNEETWTTTYNRNRKIWANPLLDDNTDFYMTPYLADKVNELQNSLEALSKRFIIRITDAYDYNFEHKKTYYRSLHYTGRAADITIYDTYQSKNRIDLLPLLYRLCVDVGFDFVLYHKGSHIHASVSPEEIPIIYAKIIKDSEDSPVNRTLRLDLEKTGKKGWYHNYYELSTGLYYVLFYTDKYEYGFRDITYIGRSDKTGYEYDYYSSPIMINVEKAGNFRFLFNPHFLRYNIVGDGSYKTIVDKSYRSISKIDDEDRDSAK